MKTSEKCPKNPYQASNIPKEYDNFKFKEQGKSKRIRIIIASMLKATSCYVGKSSEIILTKVAS